jgi:hypothetical protein
MNSLSSLFHRGLIKILFLLHLSKIGDTWESFLSRNGFSQPDNTVNSPINVNPISYNLVTKSLGFNSHIDCEVNESISDALQTPMVKTS